MNPKQMMTTKSSLNEGLEKILMRLSHSETEAREDGFKRLTKFIEEHKNKITEENIESILKGLFFYYWLCDSMEKQKRASIDISKLIYVFKKKDALMYFGTFLKIMSSKFDTLDIHRLEKFLFFFKVFQAEVLMFLHNSNWNKQYLKKYGEILIEHFDDSKDLYFSYIDTFVSEFLENDIYARKKKIRNPFTSKQFIMLMDPFFEMICVSSRRLIHDKIKQNIFQKIAHLNLNKALLKKTLENYIVKCKKESSRKVLKQIHKFLCEEEEENQEELKKISIPTFVVSVNEEIEPEKKTMQKQKSDSLLKGNQNKKTKAKQSSSTHMNHTILQGICKNEDSNIELKKQGKSSKENKRLLKDEFRKIQDGIEEAISKKKKCSPMKVSLRNKNTTINNISPLAESMLKKRNKRIQIIENHEQDGISFDECENSLQAEGNFHSTSEQTKKKARPTKTNKTSSIQASKSSSIHPKVNPSQQSVNSSSLTSTLSGGGGGVAYKKTTIDKAKPLSNETVNASKKAVTKETTPEEVCKGTKKVLKKKKGNSKKRVVVEVIRNNNMQVKKSILKKKSTNEEPQKKKKVRFNLKKNKIEFIPVDRNKAYPNLDMWGDWGRILNFANLYENVK